MYLNGSVFSFTSQLSLSFVLLLLFLHQVSMNYVDFHTFSLVKYAAVLITLWVIYSVIYRLYFHPLAKFPGPKLAIVTHWYEFYHDIVRRGQYTYKLRELHQKYGSYIGRKQENAMVIAHSVHRLSDTDQS